MSQPVDAGQYVRISGTAVGTTNVLTRSGNFIRTIAPLAKTGTATFYDQNAGTSSATLLFALNNAIAGSVSPVQEYNFRVKNGLTVVTGGTTDFVLVYE